MLEGNVKIVITEIYISGRSQQTRVRRSINNTRFAWIKIPFGTSEGKLSGGGGKSISASATRSSLA